MRYLKATALSCAAGKERAALEGHAEAAWKAVIKFARIKMASKQQAIRFLERYADNYLFHPKLGDTLKFLRESPGPKPDVDFFPQPRLASRQRAVLGPMGTRVADDLSERIYAAYHALRQAGCHGARSLVADALNHPNSGLTHRTGGKKDWGSAEVNDRLKQYEARLKRNLRDPRPKSLLLARAALLHQWISFARSQMGAPTPPK